MGVGCQHLTIDNYVSVIHSDLKKVTNTCDVEKPRRSRAISVVTPPLRTAGPRLYKDDISKS